MSNGLQQGDVLVARSRAKVEYSVSIISSAPVGDAHSVCTSYEAALAAARDLAESSNVDAWLTLDHTHLLKVAFHR